MYFQWLLSSLFACICLQLAQCEQHYKGFKVFSVSKAQNKTQYEALIELQKRPRLDFWSDPSFMRPTDIMVAPAEVQNVQQYLQNHGLNYQVAIPDVQRVVERDMKHRENRQGGMNWKQYHRLDVIYAWLESQAIQNPRLVQVSNIGRSWEGRPIKMAKVSTRGYSKKPAIVIDAGIHAREWIAPATATYIMKQLLSVSLEERDLIDSVDWYFIPVVNPDGYEHTHTEDRLWRKTRSTHNGEDCIGVDANRNFDFHWGEAGTKEDPCANTYPGPRPFSEPESNATATFLWNNRGRIKAYITLHSYSQLFLTPYGYTEELPDDYDELQELGLKAAKALEDVHGTEYEVGAPSHILYLYSGSSQDWAREVARVKYSFTLELRDAGERKFLLPESEIEESGEETWEAIKVFARHLIPAQGTSRQKTRPDSQPHDQAASELNSANAQLNGKEDTSEEDEEDDDDHEVEAAAADVEVDYNEGA